MPFVTLSIFLLDLIHFSIIISHIIRNYNCKNNQSWHEDVRNRKRSRQIYQRVIYHDADNGTDFSGRYDMGNWIELPEIRHK